METPFRVICVDGIKPGTRGYNTSQNDYHYADDRVVIFEGEYYTVTDALPWCGETYYKLAERCDEVSFLSDKFIRLSSIPESEVLDEAEKEGIVNLETV